MEVSISELRPKNVTAQNLSDLSELIGGTCFGQAQITGVSVDSNDIRPGDLFVAVPGQKTHGAAFAHTAVEKGAEAVATDEAGAKRVRRDCPDIPLIVVDDPRHHEGTLAAAVYGDPSAKMRVVGITGTNGKTTTTYLLHWMLQAGGEKAVLQGTGVQRVGDEHIYTSRTTSEAPVLQALMATGLERGMQAAALEISSHAVSLDRIRGVRFDAVGFTNLQHDHLDYYGTMEAYFEAKAGLFSPEFAKRGVVCVDDEWGQRLAKEAAIPVVTVSTNGTPAQVQATGMRPDPDTGATTFTLRLEDSEVTLTCPLPGAVNVQNACVAALVAREAGLPLDVIVDALENAPQVSGRMETIPSQTPEEDPLVIVDFAHTAEALESVLGTARALTRGKLHIVFGTDGDRDASKRADVGRAAANGADILWVTDENPRTEAPEIMRRQLFEGISQVRADLSDVTEITTCRRDAIRTAIMAAGPDDTVIITGKGGEEVQEVYYCMHPFKDQEVARECLAGRAYRRALTQKLDS